MTNSNDSSTTDATAATKKAAAERKRHNLGRPFDLSSVPAELASMRQWLPYQDKTPTRFFRGGTRNGFSNQDPVHVGSLLTLPNLLAEMDRRGWRESCSHGVMFAPMPDSDGQRWWICLDWDGLNPDDPTSWPAMLQEAQSSNAGWACLSDGGKGVRIVGFVRFDSTSGDRLINDDGRPVGAGELKYNTACSCTDRTLWAGSLDITDLWQALRAKIAASEKPAPARAAKAKRASSDNGQAFNHPCASDPEFMALQVSFCETYLAKRPPAVSGQSGHDRFFAVCNIIVRGFGLRGIEGRAIAEAWNAANSVPPFSETEVNHKWADALAETEAGRKPDNIGTVLGAWERRQNRAERNGNADGTAGAQPEQPAQPEPSTGTAQATSEPEAVFAKRARDGRWIVIPDSDNPNNTRRMACEILANETGDKVYKRMGRAVLVREKDAAIHWKDPVSGKKISRGPRSRPSIVPTEPGNLLPVVSKAIAFRKVRKDQETGRKTLVSTSIPATLMGMIRATPDELPPLRGLLFGPSYDPDCDRILSEPGYHPSTGLCLVAPVDGFNVPDVVTLEMAQKAAQLLLEPYRFFPWPESIDGNCLQRARLLVAMMTALMRWSFCPCPAILMCGKSAGSGKTEVVKSLSEIVHGCQPRLMSWVMGKGSEDELRKRFCMLLASGESMVLVDNVPTGSEIDSAVLLALLTTDGEFTDRQLGVNSAGGESGGPNTMLVCFTGNSVTPSNDLSERTLVIDFTAPEGNRRSIDPETFQDERGSVGELLPYIRKHRRELLAALLTIARGYQQAGRPRASATHWGSFSEWNNACVQPVAWALGYDPLAGLKNEWQERSIAGDTLANLASVWLRIYPGRRFTARELKWMATPPSKDDVRPQGTAYCEELAGALEEACRADDMTRLSAISVGKRVNAYAGKPAKPGRARIQGTHIRLASGGEFCLMADRDTNKNQTVFWVETFTGDPEIRRYSSAANSVNVYSSEMVVDGCTPPEKPIHGYSAPNGYSPPEPPDLRNHENEPPSASKTDPLTPLEALEQMTAQPVSWDDLARAWLAGQWPDEWLQKNVWLHCEHVNGRIQSKAARAQAKANRKGR